MTSPVNSSIQQLNAAESMIVSYAPVGVTPLNSAYPLAYLPVGMSLLPCYD